MKKKTYTFDINDITYSVKIKKTLIVDYIPHQQPSLMGRITCTSSNAPFGAQGKAHAPFGAQGKAHDKLHFDFAIEQQPGLSEDTIDLVPCFNPSVIHVPPIITETIKMCIKNYYNEFLYHEFCAMHSKTI